MIIQIKNLLKTYRHNDGLIHAIDNLSFDIPAKSFVTITGASGSGKTTLLLILGGLLRPSAGTMSYNGEKIDLFNEKAMAGFRSNHVGFIMQNFALIPYLTAWENIQIALNLKNNDKKFIKTKALNLLDGVDLLDRKNHFPKELSAGQQQRVAIARALANDPDILLADEPTGNLDPNLSDEILTILKGINERKGTTILMVTHSPAAAEYGNVRIELERGKLRKPQHQF